MNRDPKTPLESGKLPPDLLQELLGAGPPLPPEIRLGPALGEDACVIELGGGALVVATDPITLTGSEVGGHAVVINANDVAVMGVRPRWFLAAILLPEGVTASQVRALFRGMRRELETLGAALVGGHTEVTAAVRQPVVVGQMLGFAEDGHFVPTGGVSPGDAIVQVGSAPVEAAAVLVEEAEDALARLSHDVLAEAKEALRRPGISVVEAALVASELGATAMHDPTEGGLAAGLVEVAQASRVAIRIEVDSVIWFEPGRAICRELGLDPWGALASGCLLSAFPADGVEEVLQELNRRGRPARRIGTARSGAGVTLSNGADFPAFERDEVARFFAERSR